MLPARRRRGDQKLLVLGGLGGLVLIAAPFVVFSQVGGPEVPSTPTSSVAPGVQGQPQPVWVSPLPGGPVQVDNERRLTLLARGQDDAVLRNFTSTPSGGASSGWTNLGGRAGGAPVGVRDGHGELAVFFIDTDGNLRFKFQAEGPQAPVQPWGNLNGGRLVGTPAVGVDSQGKLVVVARAGDGGVRVIQQKEVGVDSWTDWRMLPAVATADLAIYRDSQGALQIFGTGPDKQLWQIGQTRPGVNDWTGTGSLGGAFSGSPAVTMDAQGSLCVYALGADGSLLRNTETAAASRTWSGWQGMGHRMVGKIFVVIDARGVLVVYGLDENGALQEVWGSPSHVESAQHGGDIAELVGAAKDATGRTYVYGIGKKGDMESTHQPAPASGPWVKWTGELGGVFIPDGR
jgi:hypothetical protein